MGTKDRSLIRILQQSTNSDEGAYEINHDSEHVTNHIFGYEDVPAPSRKNGLLAPEGLLKKRLGKSADDVTIK